MLLYRTKYVCAIRRAGGDEHKRIYGTIYIPIYIHRGPAYYGLLLLLPLLLVSLSYLEKKEYRSAHIGVDGNIEFLMSRDIYIYNKYI